MKDHVEVKTVMIEETYRKVKGRVYWYYRFYGQRQWTRQLTSYKDVPWIKANWGDFTEYQAAPSRNNKS